MSDDVLYLESRWWWKVVWLTKLGRAKQWVIFHKSHYVLRTVLSSIYIMLWTWSRRSPLRRFLFSLCFPIGAALSTAWQLIFQILPLFPVAVWSSAKAKIMHVWRAEGMDEWMTKHPIIEHWIINSIIEWSRILPSDAEYISLLRSYSNWFLFIIIHTQQQKLTHHGL